MGLQFLGSSGSRRHSLSSSPPSRVQNPALLCFLLCPELPSLSSPAQPCFTLLHPALAALPSSSLSCPVLLHSPGIHAQVCPAQHSHASLCPVLSSLAQPYLSQLSSAQSSSSSAQYCPASPASLASPAWPSPTLPHHALLCPVQPSSGLPPSHQAQRKPLVSKTSYSFFLRLYMGTL